MGLKSSLLGLKSSLLGLKSSLLDPKSSLSDLKFSLNNMANGQKIEKEIPMNITENYPKYAISGRMELHPCVLQDIGPLGPLPCSHSTSSANHSKQGIGYH